MAFLRLLILLASVLLTQQPLYAAESKLSIKYDNENTSITYIKGNSEEEGLAFRDIGIIFGIVLGLANVFYNLWKWRYDHGKWRYDHEKSRDDDFWFRAVFFPKIDERFTEFYKKWKSEPLFEYLPEAKQEEQVKKLTKFRDDLSEIRELASQFSVISEQVSVKIGNALDDFEKGLDSDQSAAFETLNSAFYQTIFDGHKLLSSNQRNQ